MENSTQEIQELPPNNTLYINNLNEKVKLDGNYLPASSEC